MREAFMRISQWEKVATSAYEGFDMGILQKERYCGSQQKPTNCWS